MQFDDDGLSPVPGGRKPGTLPARWWDETALIRASEETLEALKAAGHKYGQGELRIPNEPGPRRSIPRVSTGYGQSVAAWCLEHDA